MRIGSARRAPSPGNADATVNYSYDAVGRRVKGVLTGQSGSSWSAIQTDRFTYDAWNPIHTTSTFSATVTYRYDSDPDLSGSIQAAHCAPSGVGKTRKLCSFPCNIRSVSGSSSSYSYSYDAIAAKVDSYEYDPFQSAHSRPQAQTDNSFRFSTKYFDDEMETYYYGYRFYSPELSRFLSRDPTGEEVTFHLYAFVLNDPVNQADMLGLMCTTDRYNADLGRLFDVVSRFGGCSITAFLRADIERCDKCCDDGRYLDPGKVKASFSGGGGISCRFPVPGLSIPAIGVGVFGTFSGTVKFGGAAEYDGCTDVTTGSGSGDVIIFLGLQAALMNNWAVELSLTGEGGGSCSLSMTCANRQCDLYGQCCLRARARLVARLWFASYQRIWEAPRLCTPRARIASFSL